MKSLTNLTPAEVLLIKDSTNSRLKDLMKYTFLDLLLKQVIDLKMIKGSSLDPRIHAGSYFYIISGSNFKNYKAKEHELYFLSPFLKVESMEILFMHYIPMTYENIGSSWTFKKAIRNNDQIFDFFKQSWFSWLCRLYDLTDKGVLMKNDIKMHLKNLENGVVNLRKTKDDLLLEQVLSIGGNMFLLRNLDFKLIKRLSKKNNSSINKDRISQKRRKERRDHEEGINSFYFDDFADGSGLDLLFDYFDEVEAAYSVDFNAAESVSNDSGFDGCDGCGGCGCGD